MGVTEAQWLQLQQRLELLESQKVELSQLEALRAETNERLRLLEARLKVGAPEQQEGNTVDTVVVAPVEEPAADAKVVNIEEDDPRVYHVEESTWDAVLICGNMTKLGETFMIVAGCMLNLAVQILYCVIVSKTLATAQLDENKLKHLAVWRMVIGHKADHYDSLTQTTLVGRVCEDSGFSITSASQQDLHKELKDYELPSGINVLASTPALCIISMFCWIMIAMGDFIRTLDLARALASVPRAKTTHMTETEDGTVRLEALGAGRLLAVIFGVLIPKLGIVVALGFLGIKYLVYTKKAEDILLNAIALQFILEVDELLFQRFVPMRVRELLTRVQPLPVSNRLRMPLRCRRKFPFRQASALMLVTGILIAVVSILLAHEIKLTREGRRLLCSGNTNFFYSTDLATNAITLSVPVASKLTDADVKNIYESYPFRAVMQQTGLERVGSLADVADLGEQSLFVEGEDIGTVEELNKLTQVQASDKLPCYNLVPGDEYAYTQALAYSGEGVTSCEEVTVTNCTFHLRPFCPESCGCDRYNTGLFNRGGCSKQCDRLAKSSFETDVGVLRRNERNGVGACQDTNNLPEEMEIYFDQVQGLLLDEEQLNVNNTLGAGFVQFSVWALQELAWKTDFEYYVPRDLNFSLGRWARESYVNASAAGLDTTCHVVPFVFAVFGLDLCEMSSSSLFDGKVGHLGHKCPKTCGYCTEPRSSPYREVTWSEMADLSSWLADNPLRAAETKEEECAVYLPYLPEVLGEYCAS